MPLDPQTAVVLEALAAAGADALGSGTPQQARDYERTTLAPARQMTLPGGPGYVDVAHVEDIEVPGPAGALRARVFRPHRVGPVPTVVYLHGGGFVLGNLDTHDPHCRVICRDTEAVVVSIDYRLAPEHPFPAAYEDALAALEWTASHVAGLGGDAARLVVAGDSAGANLAAAAALASDVPLAAQLLIYPKTDFRTDVRYPSRVDNADGYFLTTAMSEWFEGHYLTDAERLDPRASVVLSADLKRAAPCVLAVGEYDLLRDEDVAYAELLREAGVDVRLHLFPGLVHGFFGMRLSSEAAAAAVSTVTAELRSLLWEA